MSDVKELQGQQSNADRIRAMSDMELASFLIDILSGTKSCIHCPVYHSSTYGVCAGGCRKAIKEWVKSPVEV